MSVLQLKLGQKEASRVAKLISNDTASTIMDALSEDSKSESELSKELDIPLSTIHYNVQKLVKAGILVSDEFTYSEKGKEIRHYRLASSHIVISTKPSAPISELVVGGSLAVVITAGVALFSQQDVAVMQAESMMMDSARSATVAADPVVWPWILLGAGIVLAAVLIGFFARSIREHK